MNERTSIIFHRVMTTKQAIEWMENSFRFPEINIIPIENSNTPPLKPGVTHLKFVIEDIDAWEKLKAQRTERKKK